MELLVVSFIQLVAARRDYLLGLCNNIGVVCGKIELKTYKHDDQYI